MREEANVPKSSAAYTELKLAADTAETAITEAIKVVIVFSQVNTLSIKYIL